jgi:hypothetical protein
MVGSEREPEPEPEESVRPWIRRREQRTQQAAAAVSTVSTVRCPLSVLPAVMDGRRRRIDYLFQLGQNILPVRPR